MESKEHDKQISKIKTLIDTKRKLVLPDGRGFGALGERGEETKMHKLVITK